MWPMIGHERNKQWFYNKKERLNRESVWEIEIFDERFKLNSLAKYEASEQIYKDIVADAVANLMSKRSTGINRKLHL